MANEFKKYDLVFLKPGIYTENPYNPLNVIGWHGGPDSRTVYWENREFNTYSPEELILPTDEEIAKYFRNKYPEGCIVAFDDGDSFKVEYDHPIRVRREADKIFVDYYGSKSYLYHNGKFATVVKKSEFKTPPKTREQLLEMFPPGTEFIPYRHNDPCHKVTVDESWVLYSSGSGAHWFKDTQRNSAHRGYVQDHDQLATIVKKAQNVKKAQKSEDLIAELQIKFPVGTVFKAFTAYDGMSEDKYVVKDTWVIHRNSTGYYFGTLSGTSTHNGYIKLHSGEEAKIIETTSIDTNAIKEFSMSPLEYVKENFPPGTVFIPEDGQGKEVIVKEDWTLNIGSRGSIWFRDELRSSVHDGFLYLARTETYAKIVTPGTVPQLENESAQVFAAIDRPVIVPKTIPTTGPNVPVIVSIPTLLKTKKKSKLISNQ
jgi:hypothetical protein